jgi:hypothetical protein
LPPIIPSPQKSHTPVHPKPTWIDFYDICGLSKRFLSMAWVHTALVGYLQEAVVMMSQRASARAACFVALQKALAAPFSYTARQLVITLSAGRRGGAASAATRWDGCRSRCANDVRACGRWRRRRWPPSCSLCQRRCRPAAAHLTSCVHRVNPVPASPADSVGGYAEARHAASQINVLHFGASAVFWLPFL